MHVFLLMLILSLPGAAFGASGGHVIYGVVPPLFGGEPLRAVTARLDALRDLGADVLWLSPLQATDDLGHISYSITDYWRLREDFGSEQDLRDLVRGAHARGMKVILDFVPNHTSVNHPYFQGGAKYRDYYQRDKAGNAVYYFDWESLPNLNYENVSVVRMMQAALRHWLRAFAIDGYRMDAAWGPRERTPSAWPQLVAAIRDENPGALLLAEAGAGDPYFTKAGFDWAYDWTSEVGVWSWARAFEESEHTGLLLARALRGERGSFSRVRFLNNNDTGARFISRYGADVTRAAAVVQFTVPGIPLVYTGDETGAEYEPYADPPPVSWRDAHGLRPFYRKLASLRARETELRDAAMTVFESENPRALVFARGRLLVAVDFAAEGRPWRVEGSVRSGGYRDLLSGRCVRIEAKQSIFIVPAAKAGARILKPARDCD